MTDRSKIRGGRVNMASSGLVHGQVRTNTEPYKCKATIAHYGTVRSSRKPSPLSQVLDVRTDASACANAGRRLLAARNGRLLRADFGIRRRSTVRDAHRIPSQTHFSPAQPCRPTRTPAGAAQLASMNLRLNCHVALVIGCGAMRLVSWPRDRARSPGTSRLASPSAICDGRV